MEDAALGTEIADSQRQQYIALGVVAWINVPLIKRGRIQAALCVVQDRPRRWTEKDLAIAEETAERIWASIERARVEAALRESERRLALAFKMLPVGMAIIDPDGGLNMSNEHMQRFLPSRFHPFPRP